MTAFDNPARRCRATATGETARIALVIGLIIVLTTMLALGVSVGVLADSLPWGILAGLSPTIVFVVLSFRKAIRTQWNRHE